MQAARTAPVSPAPSPAAEPRRRALLWLTAFRVLIGVSMPLLAWFWAPKRYLNLGYLGAETVTGAAVVWAAWRIWRAQPGRGWMGLAVAISMFVPFLFDAEEPQIYCAALLGHVGALAAIVSADIFVE